MHDLGHGVLGSALHNEIISSQDNPRAFEHLLTRQELASELRISLRHIDSLQNKRLIPFVRLGRVIRFNRIHVSRALEKLTVKEIA